jgi:hypothetical protein
MIGLLIIVSLLSMLSMLICYQIARWRKADRWYWLFAGLLFGPLAIPFAFFSSPNQR